MSGIWEEAWDGVLPSHLVTEKIDADLACMVNAWAEHPGRRLGRHGEMHIRDG